MSEDEALDLVAQHASRRRGLLLGAVAVLVVAWAASGTLARDTAPSLADLTATIGRVALWVPVMYVLVWRPARDSRRRTSRLRHLVRGDVVRVRSGVVTARVEGEGRRREWQAARRVKRLAVGDEVWLSPTDADDAPAVAVCVPHGASPFVVTDVPGIRPTGR